ncbi:MAG: isochorismatase family protein [candidate division WOR-3 bacterium]
MPILKEKYFTIENIKKKSTEMFEKIKNLKAHTKIKLIPHHSALLIIDMQEYFLNPASFAYIPASDAILPGVKKIISLYSQKGFPIIFTLHSNTKRDAGLLTKWWSDLIWEGSSLSRIYKDLLCPEGIIVKKNQYDAFYNTELEKILKEKRVYQLVIVGVLTNICCETTARSAFVRGFEVFFTIDGTATYNEDFHLATLKNLSYGFAVPVLLEEISSLLGYES